MKTKTMLAAMAALMVVSAPATFAVSDDLAELFLKQAADEMDVDTSGVEDIEVEEVVAVEVDPLADAVTADEREWEAVEATVCSDGFDNDGDGLLDFGEDLGCAAADDDSEADEIKTAVAVEATEEVAPANEVEQPAAVAVDPLAALFDVEDYESEEEVVVAPVIPEAQPVAEVAPVVEKDLDVVAGDKDSRNLPKSGPAVLGVLALAGAGALVRKKLKK